MAMTSSLPARPAQNTTSVNLARAMAAAQASRKESSPEEMRTSMTSMNSLEQRPLSPELPQQILTPQVNTEAQDYQVLFDGHEQERAAQIAQTRAELAQLIAQLPDTSDRQQIEITLIQEETYQADPSIYHVTIMELIRLGAADKVRNAGTWREFHSRRRMQQGPGIFGTKAIHDRMNDERRNTDDAA